MEKVKAERVLRSRRRPNHYEPADPEEDRQIRAAIKRSKIEQKMQSTTDILHNISEVPSIQPTLEEFNDPIGMWESLHAHGMKYGAVKLVPPQGWRPGFSVDLNRLMFEAREQHLHKLANGKAFSFPKNEWTPKTFENHSEDLSKRFFGTASPTVDQVERRYWDIVERQTQEVTTLYAADLEARKIGSGFPEKSKAPNDPYAHHPWNLVNVPACHGSLLKHYHREVPGVTSPWLYIGMVLSTFCWHTEDNYFAAVNYQHYGAPKVWYVVPPVKAEAMHRVMKEYHANKQLSSVIHSLTFQISLSILLNQKIPVYRIVQRENEYVLLWPKAFHAGINVGYNCNEACNVAPPFWLMHGYKAVMAYRYMRPMCIPHEQLVLVAARHHKSFTPERLYYIVVALVQLVLDEYSKRKAVSLPQCPFHLCGNEVAKGRNRGNDSGLKEFYDAMVLCGETSMDKIKVEDVTTLKHTNNYSSNSNDNCSDTTTGSDAVSSNEAYDTSVYDQFFDRLVALAKLPAKDCDNCQISCYSGFAFCPHSNDAMCLHCEDALECQCDFRIAVYRLPLVALRACALIVINYLKSIMKSTSSTSLVARAPLGALRQSKPDVVGSAKCDSWRSRKAVNDYTPTVALDELLSLLPPKEELVSFERIKCGNIDFFDPCGMSQEHRDEKESNKATTSSTSLPKSLLTMCNSSRGSLSPGCKRRGGAQRGEEDEEIRKFVQKQCYRFLKITMKEEADEVKDALPMAKKKVSVMDDNDRCGDGDDDKSMVCGREHQVVVEPDLREHQQQQPRLQHVQQVKI